MIFKTCIVILMIFIFVEIGAIADAMQEIAEAISQDNIIIPDELTKDDEQ